MITMKEEINLYLDLERMSANREGTISHRFANEITTKYQQVRINNVYSCLLYTSIQSSTIL